MRQLQKAYHGLVQKLVATLSMEENTVHESLINSRRSRDWQSRYEVADDIERCSQCIQSIYQPVVLSRCASAITQSIGDIVSQLSDSDEIAYGKSEPY